MRCCLLPLVWQPGCPAARRAARVGLNGHQLLACCLVCRCPPACALPQTSPQLPPRCFPSTDDAGAVEACRLGSHPANGPSEAGACSLLVSCSYGRLRCMPPAQLPAHHLHAKPTAVHITAHLCSQPDPMIGCAPAAHHGRRRQRVTSHSALHVCLSTAAPRPLQPG